MCILASTLGIWSLSGGGVREDSVQHSSARVFSARRSVRFDPVRRYAYIYSLYISSNTISRLTVQAPRPREVMHFP